MLSSTAVAKSNSDSQSPLENGPALKNTTTKVAENFFEEAAGSQSSGGSNSLQDKAVKELRCPTELSFVGVEQRDHPEIQKLIGLIAEINSRSFVAPEIEVTHVRDFALHAGLMKLCERPQTTARGPIESMEWMKEVDEWLANSKNLFTEGDQASFKKFTSAWESIKADFQNANPRLLFSREQGGREAEYAEFSRRLERIWRAYSSVNGEQSSSISNIEYFINLVLNLEDVCLQGWDGQLEQAERVARIQGKLSKATALESELPAVLLGVPAAAEWRRSVVEHYGSPILASVLRVPVDSSDVHFQRAVQAFFDHPILLDRSCENLDPSTQVLLELFQEQIEESDEEELAEQIFWRPLLSETAGGCNEMAGLIRHMQGFYNTLPWRHQEEIFAKLLEDLGSYLVGILSDFFEPEEIDSLFEIRRSFGKIMGEPDLEDRLALTRAFLNILSCEMGLEIEVPPRSLRSEVIISLQKLAREEKTSFKLRQKLNHLIDLSKSQNALEAAHAIENGLMEEDPDFAGHPETRKALEQLAKSEEQSEKIIWQFRHERRLMKTFGSWSTLTAKWKVQQIAGALRKVNHETENVELTVFGAKVWLLLLDLIQWDEKTISDHPLFQVISALAIRSTLDSTKELFVARLENGPDA